jgi:hypothetical protein
MTPRLDRWGDPVEEDETPEILVELFGRHPAPEPVPLLCAICRTGVPDPGRGICPACDAKTRMPRPMVEGAPATDQAPET